MDFKSLGSRILVAIFGAPLIIFLILNGGIAFAVLILIINLAAQYEFYKLTEHKGMLPIKILGLAGTVIITFSFYKYGIEKLWLIVLILFYLILLTELFRNKSSATLNIASTTWGLFYPAVFFGFMILLRELPNEIGMEYAVGGRWILLMLICIWICDTAAYFIGKAIGKHKLFARVSPNKTIEGAVAGLLFSLITGYIFHLTYINSLTLLQCMVIALIAGTFGQVGDLLESLFKRDAEVKDSSSILPGHGGMLDRFDAPIFAAPVVYLYLRFVVFI
ncbi:phosphatidate cytidylyltransferase [candidate division KSB1 bacterium]|nr:phosphatidate cytidylyltransferase [candidate division KSB1 bacterium]MBL7093403.1 phosphatidate cytidylyltransferase [candidate division KSB1 bacterium]